MRSTCIVLPVAALCAAWVPTTRSAENSTALDLARQLNQAFIEVADQVSPAVVVVSVAQKPSTLNLDDENNPLWEWLPPEWRKHLEQERERQRKPSEKAPPKQDSEEPTPPPRRGPRQYNGQGSGMVIREDGYILTNRHVVEEAEKIKVRFKDGAEYEAEVRGLDAQSDIAVIKIDARGKKLPVVKFADSDKTRVGEFAIAIGAPFELDYTVTYGHISAKGRSRVLYDPAMDQDFIQTDANINPGNSGGPLVNLYGEVVGVNTLIRGMSTGIGFAIPINLAREVSDKLITDGRYTRAWLGIAINALRDEPDYRDLVPNLQDGVVVKQIQPDGPAKKSDLKAGDIITAVDGTAVANAVQLKAAIRSKKIGAPVTLDVYRNGKATKVMVKPDAWPDEATQVANRRTPAKPETATSFGLTVQSLTKDLAEQFGVERTEGVVVTEVEQGSIAFRKGLRPGDIVTEVNGKTVANPKEFREAMKVTDEKKGARIIFISRGTSKFEILRDSGEE